jgi:hypothetical protein
MSRHALSRRPPSRVLTAVAIAFMVSGAVLGIAGIDAGASTPTTIGLGTTESVSVLAGAGVTNTGLSVLALDLDTSPTDTVTGFPPGETLGTEHLDDAVAIQAQRDLTTAYDAARAAPSTGAVTNENLGGRTLNPGVYTASTGLTLNGPLPLTLKGGPAAVFVFQAGSTLTTGSDSSVKLVGGVQACNIFWQLGSSATLGTGTVFVGNILALTSISLDHAATVEGRALASNGAVTLNDNTFTEPSCTTSTAPTTTTTAAPTTTTVAPTTTTTTAAPTTTTTAAPTTTTTAAPTTTTTAAPTTTTTAAPTTTTTAAPTTTTTAAPTTTVASTTTTTTVASTTTTTTVASATTTSTTPTTTTTSTTTTTTVAPTTTTALSGLTISGQGTGTGGGSTTGGSSTGGDATVLATTGTDAEGLGLGGAGLVGAGSLLLLLTRRRRYS